MHKIFSINYTSGFIRIGWVNDMKRGQSSYKGQISQDLQRQAGELALELGAKSRHKKISGLRVIDLGGPLRKTVLATEWGPDGRQDWQPRG